MALSDILNQQTWDLYGQNPAFGDPQWQATVQQGIDVFKQQFQNLTGQAPTLDQINQYAQQGLHGAWNTNGNMTYGDQSGLANSYIQNAFGPQAAAYSQQQQTNQLGTDQSLIQNLINQTMGNTATALSDPNSQIYQTLAGSMNNMGITPGSGAFQAGAGSTIANAGLGAANEGLQAIGIPAIQGIGQTGQNPYQGSFGSGQTAMGNLEGINNFDMQSKLAQFLQQQGQPSGIMNDIGMASGAAQGTGSLLQGGAQAYKLTWICTAMKRAGAMNSSEVQRIHAHLFKAIGKRPFKFLGYFIFGRLLVWLAENFNTNWYLWKSEFYDIVMEEQDPVKAVDLYETAFWHLFRIVWMRQKRTFA